MRFSKVMIVDDNEGDLFLAEMEIKKFDERIQILQARDGQEALEILAAETTKPDIILLDINMPRMDGLTFLSEYSKQGYTSEVVVMLTSSDQKSDRDAAMNFGCVRHYLLKLLDHTDLETLKSL